MESKTMDVGDANATYEGNDSQDVRDMRRLGNKQELKRNFHSLAVLGLTSLLVQTWAGMISGIPYALINGGRGGAVWSYFGTWMLQFPMIASLAEMASMAPTAAGQYGWISEFAPKSIQKPLSYVAGWLGALGWQTIIAATAYGVSGATTTLVSIARPQYTPQLWQITLLMIAIGVVAIMFNILAAKRIPLFEGVILFLYMVGFFIVIIPLWILSPKVSSTEVFLAIDNYGGWSSTGAACVIAQTAAASAFIGFDAAAHVSEEVKNAAIAVPRIMMATLALNGALGFIMVITFCFVLQDIDRQILQSEYPFPFVTVFADATNSIGWALAMTAPIILTSFFACINAVMAASRQMWSLARDGGVPLSHWFVKISIIDSTPVPAVSMIFSLALLIIIALLNLGGSKIINSIIGLLGGAIGTTYIISISCVLWRRAFSDTPLPCARWSLGKFGIPINAIAIAYQTMATVTSFFPVYAKINARGMNWSVVVFVGVALLCAISYITVGKRTYRGPVVRISKGE